MLEREALGQVVGEERLAPRPLGRIPARHANADGSSGGAPLAHRPLAASGAARERGGRAMYRPPDRLIACATAQVVAQSLCYFGVVGVGLPVEEGLGRENHAGRAEAALYRAFFDKGALYRMEFAVPSIVTMLEPESFATLTRQDLLASPLMMTVQAPQAPFSQPFFAPTRPSSSRRKRRRESEGSTLHSMGRPLTLSEIKLWGGKENS
jgi:hypothetical protein